MVRALRTGIRAIGWLLTPALVWGAAFAGSWLGARLATYVTSTVWALAITLGSALLAGGATLVLWVRALLRLAHAAGAERRDRRQRQQEGGAARAALVTLDEAAD